MTYPDTDPRHVAVWDRPADQLRDNANAAFDRIRNNPAYTADAARILMARAWVTMRDKMAALQQQSGQAKATDLSAARRAVFGIDDVITSASPAERASVAISWRDAQDRAAQSQGGEQQQLATLESADISGDELLVRAIGGQALQRGLGLGGSGGAVADEYLAMRPKIAAAWTRLQQMNQPITMAGAWEFITPKPPELGASSDAHIEYLSSQADSYGA